MYIRTLMYISLYINVYIYKWLGICLGACVMYLCHSFRPGKMTSEMFAATKFHLEKGLLIISNLTLGGHYMEDLSLGPLPSFVSFSGLILGCPFGRFVAR